MESKHILNILEDTLDALIQNAQLLQDDSLDEKQKLILQDQQNQLLDKLFDLQNQCQEPVYKQDFQKKPDLYSDLTNKTQQLSKINQGLLRSNTPQQAYRYPRSMSNRKAPCQLFLDLP